MSRHGHHETHRAHRAGWLRAAVLGANDGIVSTASLILGVAASGAGREAILIAGVAALVAGAMSMAAGEYVSVSSQADAEHADLAIERRELANDPDFELDELTALYRARGVEPETARAVATQLMAHDALGAHARDELNITELTAARPIMAAIASAAMFAAGALPALILAAILPRAWLVPGEVAVALLCLAALGWIGALAGGAAPWRPVARVTFWGALAMALTAAIGGLIGTAV